MADRFWLDAVLIARTRFGLGSSATYMVLVIIGGAPDAVDGQGIYYLDLASTISTEPEAAVEFCAGKGDRSAVAMAVIFQSEFRRFLEQLGRRISAAASTVPS